MIIVCIHVVLNNSSLSLTYYIYYMYGITFISGVVRDGNISHCHHFPVIICFSLGK